MADNHFPLRDRSQERWPRRDSGAEIQYVLRAEEQILHSISAGIPLTDILNKICDSLNSEMGNMISLVSLPNDDDTGVTTIVKSAQIFGLYKFCSAAVVGRNREALGSIEMYSCIPRRPFLNEIRLIERATCLAAIAIKHHSEEGNHSESTSTTLKREVLT
jgi:hypothetical protein